MSNAWRELDVKRVPTDIFEEGAWESKCKLNSVSWRKSIDKDPMLWIQNIRHHGMEYRIRRPEGWEPKECPTCGSDDKAIIEMVPCSLGGLMPCPDSWHDEPKAPTHEEIMTKWWSFADLWIRVSAYNSVNKKYTVDMGEHVPATWFSDRESADTPPETP